MYIDWKQAWFRFLLVVDEMKSKDREQQKSVEVYFKYCETTFLSYFWGSKGRLISLYAPSGVYILEKDTPLYMIRAILNESVRL